MRALVTGSGGLIGSECVRVLCESGACVIGVDNDMRAQFFGAQGTTKPVVEELVRTFPQYRAPCTSKRISPDYHRSRIRYGRRPADQ